MYRLYLFILIVAFTLVGCNVNDFGKGDLLTEEEVVLTVLSKDDLSLTIKVYDEDGVTVDIPSSKTIFYSLSPLDKVQGIKRVFEKQGVKSAYYSFKTESYNSASMLELLTADKLNETVVEVEILNTGVERNTRSQVVLTYYGGSTYIPQTISTPYNEYYIIYGYEGEPYAIREEVSERVYSSAKVGQKLLALKKDYKLKDGDVISKYSLVTANNK